MTSYSTIANASIDQDSPVTQSLMTAMRDNPVAMAEGNATGAPVIATAWHPYNQTAVGDGNDGVIWEAGVDANTDTITTPDFDAGYSYRILVIGLGRDDNGLGANNLRLRAYRSVDAAYTTAHSDSLGDGATFTLDWLLERPWLSGTVHFSRLDGVNSASTVYDEAGHFYDSTTQIISRAQIDLDSTDGNVFNAGKVILERRLDYLAGEI